MSSTPTTADELFSRKVMQKALKVWHDSKKLGLHRFARLNIVEAERKASGYSETPAGYGLALRQVLEQAIETLKPDEAQPSPLTKPWRPYFIVTERFIKNHAPSYICEQLAISERTFRNEQGEGFNRLADALHLLERQEEQKATEAEQKVEDKEEEVVLNVPFLAPPKPTYALIGRDQLLANLKQRLFTGDSVALFALNGLPGVGKTALSIALAHDPELQAHFSDGVLWVGLGREPDLLSSLNVWALALGISASDMGQFVTIKQKARGIQAAIGMRRMLLVIDDAWQSSDALAFQLGGPNCAHILTTRLGGVAWDFAQEGAKAVQELNEADSLALLSQFVPEVVINEPQKARTLVKAVGGLPLALTLMGNYLRKSTFLNPSDGLQAALDTLQQTEERLRISQHLNPLAQQPTLAANVPLSLLASIEISDSALEPPARHALRALATFPPKPNSFSQEAALTVSDKPLQSLNHLTEAGLLERSGDERYTLHQTISDYARLQQPSQNDAYWRATCYFAEFAQIFRNNYQQLDADWQNVLHFLQWAYENQRWQVLAEGVKGLTHRSLGAGGFMDVRGHWTQIKTLLEKALESAKVLNDQHTESSFLTKLALFTYRLGDVEAAKHYLKQNLTLLSELPASANVLLERTQIYELMFWIEWRYDLEIGHSWLEQGEEEIEAWPSQNEALTYQKGYLRLLSSIPLWKVGQLDQALKAAEEGIALLPSVPTSAKLTGLIMLGNVSERLGKINESITYKEEAVQLAQQLGDLRQEAILWNNLGIDKGNLGNLRVAISCFHKALLLHQQLKRVVGQVKTHYNLGMFYIVLGEGQKANEHLNKAIELAEKHALAEDKAFALTHLGSLQIYQGILADATSILKQAEEICISHQLGYLLMVVFYWQAELSRFYGNHEQALALVDKSLRLAQERSYLLEEGIAWSIKGKILDAMSHFQEAYAAHQRSLALLCEHPVDLAQSKLALGEHYLMRDTQRARCGELSQRAKSWLEEALVTFEKLGAKREIAKVRGLLGNGKLRINN